MGRTKGSGAGSVYKRGNKWRGQITVDGVRLSRTADRKKDVLDWIASVRNDGAPKTSDYTVEEWFKIYEELLSNITTEALQKALPKMFSEKMYSDGTYRVFHTRLKDGFEYAVKQNIITRNPAIDLIMPKQNIAKTVDAYTAEDQKKIVEYCRNSDGLDRVYYFLIATGVRVGEAICLTWNDVNLKEGYIDINKTAVKGEGGIIVQPHPKTGQSIRRIYLSQNTILFMRRLKGSECRKASDLVLPNRNGNIYNVSTLRQHWMRTCAKLNIPYKSMHALRHSWATRALEGNIPVQTVSKMLGHKSVATTMDIYQSIFSESKKNAAQIMNQFV